MSSPNDVCLCMLCVFRHHGYQGNLQTCYLFLSLLFYFNSNIVVYFSLPFPSSNLPTFPFYSLSNSRLLFLCYPCMCVCTCGREAVMGLTPEKDLLSFSTVV